MPFDLTPAQIQLAYDIEAIQEALASGYVLPPKADPVSETEHEQEMAAEHHD